MKVHIFSIKEDLVDIFKNDVYRGPNIGIYTEANDDIVFIPRGYTKAKAEKLSEYLDAEIVYTSIANTRLLGTLMAINNHGLLLPPTATPTEYEYLKKVTGLNVEFLDSKYTALGNLICSNDKGAIVSPMITKENVKVIEDVLDVEVMQKKIAGYHQVGAMAFVNMHGGVIHPEVNDKDIKSFSSVLGVKIEPATINGGVPFVSSGILSNNNAIVVGTFTTGPEIMMLTSAFF